MPKAKTRRHCIVKLAVEFDVNLMEGETTKDAEIFIAGKAMEAIIFEYGGDIENYTVESIEVGKEETIPIVSEPEDEETETNNDKG